MVELEEEEEAGCYTAKKEEAHMDHHSVMGSWLFGEAVHDLLWVLYAPPIGGCIFRWAEPCVASRPQTP